MKIKYPQTLDFAEQRYKYNGKPREKEPTRLWLEILIGEFLIGDI